MSSIIETRFKIEAPKSWEYMTSSEKLLYILGLDEIKKFQSEGWSIGGIIHNKSVVILYR